MNRLADADVVLNSALPRVLDNEERIKERMETTIIGIKSARLRVLKLLLNSD